MFLFKNDLISRTWVCRSPSAVNLLLSAYFVLPWSNFSPKCRRHIYSLWLSYWITLIANFVFQIKYNVSTIQCKIGYQIWLFHLRWSYNFKLILFFQPITPISLRIGPFPLTRFSYNRFLYAYPTLRELLYILIHSINVTLYLSDAKSHNIPFKLLSILNPKFEFIIKRFVLEAGFSI